MAETAENAAPVAVAVTEEQPAKEVIKEKTPKEKKPKAAKAASHPPYFQMITEALLALNEKSGSSPYAIAKYMEEKHKSVLPNNFKKILALQLKNSAARGKLIKIKASYKISESGKKDTNNKKTKKTPKSKPKVTPKPTQKRTRSSTAKPEAVKKAKRSTSAKPKQAKSIKSPAAKKAKKASVTA